MKLTFQRLWGSKIRKWNTLTCPPHDKASLICMWLWWVSKHTQDSQNKKSLTRQEKKLKHKRVSDFLFFIPLYFFYLFQKTCFYYVIIACRLRLSCRMYSKLFMQIQFSSFPSFHVNYSCCNTFARFFTSWQLLLLWIIWGERQKITQKTHKKLFSFLLKPSSSCKQELVLTFAKLMYWRIDCKSFYLTIHKKCNVSRFFLFLYSPSYSIQLIQTDIFLILESVTRHLKWGKNC